MSIEYRLRDILSCSEVDWSSGMIRALGIFNVRGPGFNPQINPFWSRGIIIRFSFVYDIIMIIMIHIRVKLE